MNYQKSTIYIILLLFALLINPLCLYSQSEKTEGTWLLSKTEPTVNINSKEYKVRMEKFASLLNAQLEDDIIPQALDRNSLGELLILSQTSPPAEKAGNWALQAYQNEKEMLKDMELKAQKRLYPAGFDVQKDGAYVLFLKSSLTMEKFRLIKIQSVDELNNSLNTYLELGLIPLAISFYTNSLWIMYGSFKEINTEKLELQAKSIEISKLASLLDETLAAEKKQVLAMSIAGKDRVLVLFQVEN